MIVDLILKFKGRHVSTVDPKTRILDLLIALEAEDVGALVVSTDGVHIDGIISERDVVRGLNRDGLSIIYRPISELMQREVQTCGPKSAVRDVMNLMRTHRIRHMPVVDGEHLTGLVDIHDIVSLRLEEVESEAEYMRDYIGMGSQPKKASDAPTEPEPPLH